MCQLCLVYFYFFNIYICTKRYHGMHKYQQINFFSSVVKSIRPTYGNKEELAPLRGNQQTLNTTGNPGNFLSLMKLIGNHDPIVKQHLEKPKFKNATWILPGKMEWIGHSRLPISRICTCNCTCCRNFCK